jgi:hypothetical protein
MDWQRRVQARAHWGQPMLRRMSGTGMAGLALAAVLAGAGAAGSAEPAAGAPAGPAAAAVAGDITLLGVSCAVASRCLAVGQETTNVSLGLDIA